MKTKKMVFTALFIALSFVTTYAIKFSTPTGGYIHFGDLSVLMSGMLLGPVYGAIAAGLGSALADIIGGYGIYAPATLIIKASMAFAVGSLYKKLNGEDRMMNQGIRIILHSVLAYSILVAGYFFTKVILVSIGYSTGTGGAFVIAASGIPANSLQVSFGIVASFIFYIPLKKPFNDIYNN